MAGRDFREPLNRRPVLPGPILLDRGLFLIATREHEMNYLMQERIYTGARSEFLAIDRNHRHRHTQ